MNVKDELSKSEIRILVFLTEDTFSFQFIHLTWISFKLMGLRLGITKLNQLFAACFSKV